jgi:hypothetical protein
LRDAEYDRGEEGEHDCSREVGKADGHGFFPSAM